MTEWKYIILISVGLLTFYNVAWWTTLTTVDKPIRISKKNNLVLMISNVKPDKNEKDNYLPYTIELNSKWAEHNGYEFKFVKINECKHPTYGPRVWWWCRLKVILDLIDDYEWVIYMDGDAYFTNKNNYFSSIFYYLGHESEMDTDQPPTQEEWLSEHWHRVVPETHVILGKDVNNFPGICMGVNVWKRSQISKSILLDLWNSPVEHTLLPLRNKNNKTVINHSKNLQRGGMGEQPVINAILFDLLHEGKSFEKYFLSSKYYNSTRSQIQMTHLKNKNYWLNHISIIPAEWFYRGLFIHHATLGSSPWDQPSKYKNCGNKPHVKFKNCIKPAYDKIINQYL